MNKTLYEQSSGCESTRPFTENLGLPKAPLWTGVQCTCKHVRKKSIKCLIPLTRPGVLSQEGDQEESKEESDGGD